MVQLSPEMVELLKHHKRAQEATLGRPPGPDDLVFPDVSRGDLHGATIAGLLRIGARTDVIAAYEATERVVLPGTRRMLDDADLAEWDEALDAHRHAHPNEEHSDLEAMQESFDAELHRAALGARPH